MTEYEACIAGLEAALDLNVKDIEVYGDSILIINQPTGEWSPKISKIQEVFKQIRSAFRSVSFNYLPQSMNQFADALAALSSMIKISDQTDLYPIEVTNNDRPVDFHNV